VTVRMIGERFATRVAGVSFAGDYPVNLYRLRDLMMGPTEASLIREPDNQFDPNAVAVLCAGDVIGHVPATIAARLAPVMDGGARYRVTGAAVLVNPEHPERPGFEIVCELVA
jgi:hypothetical protein